MYHHLVQLWSALAEFVTTTNGHYFPTQFQMALEFNIVIFGLQMGHTTFKWSISST